MEPTNRAANNAPRQGLDRATVIAAAVKLTDKKGYVELTLGNLARKLDIKPPSLSV